MARGMLALFYVLLLWLAIIGPLVWPEESEAVWGSIVNVVSSALDLIMDTASRAVLAVVRRIIPG